MVVFSPGGRERRSRCLVQVQEITANPAPTQPDYQRLAPAASTHPLRNNEIVALQGLLTP
jgi:hypothetical protein